MSPFPFTYSFESFANSEGYKTIYGLIALFHGLRALLIQKGTKLNIPGYPLPVSLRALLIQKGTKLIRNPYDLFQV